MSSETQAPTLKRHLTTTTLTFYGVGVIVGAGIYVLVGKIAGIAGNAVWLVFVASAVAAMPTGLSYAELASRYPKSAGEAVYADRAFNRGTLSFVVGFLIFSSGIASAAALSHGFAAYLGQFVSWPHWLSIVLFITGLTWLNHRGIRESTWVNIFCTVVSVSALLLIIALGAAHWGDVNFFDVARTETHDAGSLAWLGIGAALAFYAYIGFEDICNVAEEVKAPERTIPRAIIISMIFTSLIYVGIALTVVSVATPQELEASSVPLALVFERLVPFASPLWLSAVALFAIINSELLNTIMASRILYGMAKNGWIPAAFSYVHPRRQPPTWGVLAAGALTLIFALTGFLKVLAEATGVVILSAFFMVNLSLLVVKVRKVPPDDPEVKHFSVPSLIPIFGLLTTGYLAAQFSIGAYVRAGCLAAFGLVLYLIHKKGRP